MGYGPKCLRVSFAFGTETVVELPSPIGLPETAESEQVEGMAKLLLAGSSEDDHGEHLATLPCHWRSPGLTLKAVSGGIPVTVVTDLSEQPGGQSRTSPGKA